MRNSGPLRIQTSARTARVVVETMQALSLIGAILAWGATAFTYKLPELFKNASPNETQPFVFAFAGLAVVLTLVALKKLSS